MPEMELVVGCATVGAAVGMIVGDGVAVGIKLGVVGAAVGTIVGVGVGAGVAVGISIEVVDEAVDDVLVEDEAISVPLLVGVVCVATTLTGVGVAACVAFVADVVCNSMGADTGCVDELDAVADVSVDA